MHNEMGSPINDGNDILIKKYESMLSAGGTIFFDLDEFEYLIEHFLQSFEIRKAKETLKLAFSQHPKATSLLLHKASLFSLSQHYEKAIAVLDKIERLECYNPDYHLTKAAVLMQMGDHEKAIKSLKQALLLEPDNKHEIYYKMGMEFQHAENYQQAIRYLKKSLKLDPKNVELQYEIAWCYEILNDYDSCIEFYKHIIDHSPYSMHAWYNLGCIYNKLELYEKAIDAFDFALAISNDWPDVYFNKGNALTGLEKYREALENYNIVLTLESPTEIVYYYIGECYENLLEFDLAIEYYKKALLIDPEYADALLGVGICLDMQGQSNQAIPYVLKAIDMMPDNPVYWRIFGKLHVKLGCMQVGAEAYTKAFILESDKEVLIEIIKDFFIYEMHEEAVEALTQKLTTNEDKDFLFFALAAVFLKTASPVDAREMLLAGLESDPEGYKFLFDLLPEARNKDDITTIINSYKIK